MLNIKTILFLIIFTTTFCTTNTKQTEDAQSTATIWDNMTKILEEIKPPTFPDLTINVSDSVAGKADTVNFQRLINKMILSCHNNGGGKVVVSPGEYAINGPIILKSNVNLHLEEGAILKFSVAPSDYLPLVKTRWEGMDCMNYSPLIYAYQEENIAITGKGMIDGQSNDTNWWPWKGRKEYGWEQGMPNQNDEGNRPELLRMVKENTPIEERVFGEGHYLRPSFVQPYECKNILIKDITIKDSPMWVIHPVFSENLTVEGVTIKSHGPNSDGCDPESCKNVLIKGCYFDTGDDCIAIKSGRNEDGRKLNIPSENIVIQDCIMKDGHGGVVIGSEISGGCRNVYAENCEMDSPNLDRALRIKTNKARGGTIEKIYLRNIKVGQVGEAVKINMNYSDQEFEEEFLPVIKDVIVEGMTVENAKYAVYMDGLDGSHINNVIISDSEFKNVEKEQVIKNADSVFYKNVMINGKAAEPKM